MNRARTLLIAAALCAITAAPLFATGEEETSTASAAADNPWTDGQDLSGSTVNVFGAFVDVDAERFDASMAPFEEQTGIDIVYEGSGDFESLVVIRAEGGDPPDIAAFPQPGLMADMVRRGFIVDLSQSFSMDYLQQQYSNAWIDLSRVDDTIAGVWYRASLKSLVWYAKPVFEAEGYEIPETWDELGRALRADGRRRPRSVVDRHRELRSDRLGRHRLDRGHPAAHGHARAVRRLDPRRAAVRLARGATGDRDHGRHLVPRRLRPGRPQRDPDGAVRGRGHAAGDGPAARPDAPAGHLHRRLSCRRARRNRSERSSTSSTCRRSTTRKDARHSAPAIS